jgi:pyruvate-ferredoxin/flavodoxin oxidoreductase
VACHQETFLESMDLLDVATEGGTFLLNTTAPADRAWDRLPREVQEVILGKHLRFFVIDAYEVAQEAGLGHRINTVMQTCFFTISGVLPIDQALSAIKASIQSTYGGKSDQVVAMNIAAVDAARAALHEVTVPDAVTSTIARRHPIPEVAPDFVRRTTAAILEGRGDQLPVSALPVDGTFPSDTARWEKRNIALEIPGWDERWCIQCNKCAIVCPHAAIRVKAYPKASLETTPSTFKSIVWKGHEFPPDTHYTVQVAPEDCTGCGICVEVCPARNKSETRFKAINMVPQAPLREQERENYRFFLGLPEADRTAVHRETVKGSQLLQPLFEYSGACAGCGETPYVKLLTQLLGDRIVVANATGCSSIYGGNLPTTPWAVDRQGRGPAWSNSLFEDNAEFGLGLDPGSDEARLARQRERVAELKRRLQGTSQPEARDLLALADTLVRKSVWIVGGDGWAYDIGFGGLDHVLHSGHDVNVLVLDTEVYSNTGGQASKATPRAAVAKFAAAGKSRPRKDLAGLAIGYGGVYVARIAMGASDAQTVKAFLEAEAYPGPSLIVAYSHCIAHGINMTQGMQQQKLAVDSGYWPLVRYHPHENGSAPGELHIDSKPPRIPLEEYAYRETRYRLLTVSRPEEARRLLQLAQQDVERQWERLRERTRPDKALAGDARERREHGS